MKNVICYINQFFAGIGGEDKADYKPEVRDGVMGPTAAINQMLAEIDARVTTTVICGDNFMSTHRDEAIERILTALEGREFDLFLAGPASRQAAMVLPAARLERRSPPSSAYRSSHPCTRRTPALRCLRRICTS